MLLVAIGVVYRLYRLTAPLGDAHAFRQTQTASSVWLYHRLGFDLFDYHVPMFGGGYWILEFPFYQWIVFGLTEVFGHRETMGRLVSILAYVGTSALLYRITHRLTGRRGAAVGALLFLSLLPITVYFQRAVMIDPLLIMMSLLVAYALLRLVEQFRWTWFAILAVAVVVTALGKANLLVVLMGLIVPLGLRVMLDRRTPLPGRIGLVVLPIVTGVLFKLWLNRADRINEASNGMTFASMRWWYLGTDFLDGALWRTVGQRVFDQLTLGGLLAVVAGMVAVGSVRTRHRLELVAMFVGAVISIGIFKNLNGVHDYYQLPYYPILAVFGGLGLLSLHDGVARLSRSGAIRVMAAVAATLGIVWTLNLFNGYFGNNAVSTAWREAGAKLRAATPDEKLLIIQEGGDPNEPNLLYEARRIGWRINNDRQEEATRIARTTRDLGAIVVYLGAGGMPSWVPPLAAERGWRQVPTTPDIAVWRAPG